MLPARGLAPYWFRATQAYPLSPQPQPPPGADLGFELRHPFHSSLGGILGFVHGTLDGILDFVGLCLGMARSGTPCCWVVAAWESQQVFQRAVIRSQHASGSDLLSCSVGLGVFGC